MQPLLGYHLSWFLVYVHPILAAENELEGQLFQRPAGGFLTVEAETLDTDRGIGPRTTREITIFFVPSFASAGDPGHLSVLGNSASLQETT
jgi:hypothetical protein